MRRHQLLALIALALLAAAVLSGCSRLVPPSASSLPAAATTETPAATATPLPKVEVRNYKGAKLDAVKDEPENSIKGPQTVDIKTYRLKVEGLVSSPLSLTYADVLAMPAFEKATQLHCVEGWTVTYLWRGVRLGDLLAKAGYDKSAKIVIFRCADGYSTSLPLDFIVNRNILLAYRMNGLTTPRERGFPFQVIAEDQWGYKWAKWVTSIEVSNDTSFRGYWESRGYENSATIPGSK